MTGTLRRWSVPVAFLAAALLAALGIAAPAGAGTAHHTAPLLRGITLHPASVQHGSPKITVPFAKAGTINRLGGGNLLWHGGPVQQDPQVYVIYWGLWWSSTCSGQLGNGGNDEAYLGALYSGIGTSSDTEAPIASQYGPTDPIYPTVAGHALIQENVYCDGAVPASATDAQLAAVAVAYANFLASGGHSINNNTQIVVVSPSGTNPGGGFGSQYCAYHNWAQYSSTQLLSWTNLPYMPDQGGNCGANFVQNAFDGWSIVGGHEFTESVTDPFVNNQSAWYDNAGFEIGDKCAWTGLFAETMSTGTFAMQPEWDNRTSNCQAASTYPKAAIKLKGKSTFCVDDFGGSLANNTKVDISGCNGFTRQTWVAYPDGSLRRSLNTGQCINIANHSTANGALIDLYRCSGGWNQQWSYNNTTHEWVNPTSGKCLRDPNYSTTSGTQLQLWACNSTYGSEQWTNV
jgi:serine protease